MTCLAGNDLYDVLDLVVPFSYQKELYKIFILETLKIVLVMYKSEELHRYGCLKSLRFDNVWADKMLKIAQVVNI